MSSYQADELATVINNFLPSYNTENKLPPYKLRTLNALQKCRTEYMGGHIEACQDCGEVRVAYNSCRNRHCPKCGAIEKEKWIMNREVDLLPVKYFHVVFTVPDKLNNLFLNNQEAMYNLLFSVAWDVMKDFGKTKKWIGGRIGATAILHTNGQNLHYHPHLHLIVPAGALMPNGKWKHSRSRGKYLFKVEQLSNVFRARFVERTRKLARDNDIRGKVPGNLFDKDWVVYAKQPFGGAKQVINYLSRYTHRTAISNDRIKNVDERTVTFSWKDYKNNYARQTTTLPGEEFLRLFTMHILPPGFTRIRHYGIISSASKTKSLAIIRASLNVVFPLAATTEKPWQEIAFERMGIKPGICKCCGGEMVIIQILPDQFRNSARAPPGKLCLVNDN
ncbi:MAG TPA: IS91 family transposase [Thermotogaceae bacterium]|nr:IS91 family transposase [Thermotogaceae bacterium]